MAFENDAWREKMIRYAKLYGFKPENFASLFYSQLPPPPKYRAVYLGTPLHSRTGRFFHGWTPEMLSFAGPEAEAGKIVESEPPRCSDCSSNCWKETDYAACWLSEPTRGLCPFIYDKLTQALPPKPRDEEDA